MLRKSAFLAALILWLAAFAMPAAASTVPAASAPRSVADHVDPADCDEIGLSGETLTVNGVPLTTEQIVAMGLADLILVLAAEATGDSDAETCFDVAALPGRPVVNGHLSLCGPVERVPGAGNHTGALLFYVGGVPVRDGASTSDTTVALQVADAAGVDACLSADIVDNHGMVYAVPGRVCATAILREATQIDGRTLYAVIGSTSMVLGNTWPPMELADPLGLLVVGQPARVGLSLLATGDLWIHGGTFSIGVSSATDCGAAPLPDAAMSSDESPLTTMGLVLVALAMAWAVYRPQEMQN